MPLHNFERPRGRILEIEVESEGLADNIMGDPGLRTVVVYLPQDYDETDADYPLFVDLAAFGGSGLKRIAWSTFGESVPQRVDRLVAEGKMGPAIFAFPDAFTALGGNQYVDTPVLGQWETFVAKELVAQLEARFRIRRGARNRAVYGKSSGGYGALIQGMRHGTRWGAVACQSGDMGFDRVYLRDFPKMLDALAEYDGDIETYLEAFDEAPKLHAPDLHVVMLLAMAASYDPDPDAPWGIRLPVDPHTCALIPERWKRWLAHDPVRLVERSRCQKNLASLRGLFIDCGSRDQYFLHYGARELTARLQAHGIEHHYEEFDDDHSAIDYRLDVSLPFLYRAVGS